MSTGVLAFFALVSVACGSKILMVFPTPMHSHYVLSHTLAQELAKIGHDVTYVTPFPGKLPGNLTEISVGSVLDTISGQKKELLHLAKQSFFDHVRFLTNLGLVVTEETLRSAEVQTLLASGAKYDLVIVSEVLTVGLLGIAHHFESPLVLFSTMPMFSWSCFRHADPRLSSYLPNILTGFTSRMSFWERVQNTASDLISVLYHQVFILPRHAELVKSYIPGGPNLYSFLNNHSLVLVNSHMSSYEALPQLPNVVEIGGFHIKPAQALPQDLQSFLDGSRNGVVLFSLGTNLKSADLPEHALGAILDAFRVLDVDVLWKWEREFLPNKPSNVKILEWVPQRDVLAHPNVRAFISHGGLLSTMESLYYAVPIVGIPVFADQRMNVELARSYGYAEVVPLEEISTERLLQALRSVLYDGDIKRNAVKRSKIMRDRPIHPLKNAIYWVEHAIRFGNGAHLRYAGADLYWFQRQLYDVYLVGIIFLVLVVNLTYFVIRKCLSFALVKLKY